MPSILTSEQILALAPDAASARAGAALATGRKWTRLGGDGRAVWGECQGSGARPYQTRADLADLAAKCSCPSRKFPCKHGLALLLLLTTEPELFAAGEPPAWVSEWLATRPARRMPRRRHGAPKRARARWRAGSPSCRGGCAISCAAGSRRRRNGRR